MFGLSGVHGFEKSWLAAFPSLPKSQCAISSVAFGQSDNSLESTVHAHICGKRMFYLGRFLLGVELQECFLGLDRMCLVLKVQNWAQ